MPKRRSFVVYIGSAEFSPIHKVSFRYERRQWRFKLPMGSQQGTVNVVIELRDAASDDDYVEAATRVHVRRLRTIVQQFEKSQDARKNAHGPTELSVRIRRLRKVVSHVVRPENSLSRSHGRTAAYVRLHQLRQVVQHALSSESPSTTSFRRNVQLPGEQVRESVHDAKRLAKARETSRRTSIKGASGTTEQEI